MQVIKIPSSCGRPKSYSGLKVIFDGDTSITFTSVQLMPFVRYDWDKLNLLIDTYEN